MDWSEKFIAAFCSAYTDVRGIFSVDEWEKVWTQEWNRFMLWNPLLPQSKAVLEMTAAAMGLRYWNREPFRVDAAFVRGDLPPIGNLPLPLIVVIEHERNLRGFKEEIAKLAHIRCPLKVGITYSRPTKKRGPDLDARIAEEKRYIEAWIADVCNLVEAREDPATEYVYLLGVERNPRAREWNCYRHTADRPSSGAWTVLEA